jgi:peptidoglycan/xylan/chitin deacetylase (PgdA/CDA1 family)
MRFAALTTALLATALLLAGCVKTRREARVVAHRLRENTARAVRHVRRGVSEDIYRAEEHSGEIIWRVKTKKKVVALTLDDGPDPKYTPTVLALARKKGLKLTFFLVGREIVDHPSLARQEVAEGHAIGNHSWDHPNMTQKSEHQDLREIERCEDEIERICGERTHLFRPPKGYWDGDTFRAGAGLGYRMILWSIALEHHSAKTPEAMAKRVADNIAPGMIILAHDGEPCHPVDRHQTIKALPLLVEALQAKGYRFVTIPELLALGSKEP